MKSRLCLCETTGRTSQRQSKALIHQHMVWLSSVILQKLQKVSLDLSISYF